MDRAARIVMPPRRGLRRADAALYIGVSPSKLDELVASGRLPEGRRLDGCVLWDIRALDRFLDRLFETVPPSEGQAANPWDAR